MDYLEGLNEPQRRAVMHEEGPLMIVAGAGSGKTRVLTHRIAHLMSQGIDAFNIIALTFTNKAAGEMRERIEKLVGLDARNLWMGTFHSIFAKILRFEASRIGFDANFSIYDTDDSKSLIRSIVKELALDDKVYKPNRVLNRISRAKNQLVSYKAYKDNPQYHEEDVANRIPEMKRIYELYQRRCFRSNAMDFDDLLFNTNILLRDHQDILAKYQNKFRFLMIDEFQDTNYSQYLIVKRLAAQHHNICVVGDDAQSIYAFRGADIQNILNFQRDFQNAVMIRLEQNYRSTKNIVQAANSVIDKNLSQIKKQVWTDNEPGNLIRVIKAVSDSEEGKLIANDIFQEKVNYNLDNNNFAILYRTNAQSRAMEDALRKMNIKYRIIGGLSFYQRKEIKDLIAYLRFSINHNDGEALRRVINLPKRGIGDVTIGKIMSYAEEAGSSVWEILKNIKQYMKGRVANAITSFVTLIQSFEILAEQADAYTFAEQVARNSGILKELYEDKTIEGLSRYENIKELLNAIKEYVDNPENLDANIATFLQEVSLITSIDESKDDDEDKVTLMTIHAAKGLEFSRVYVVGLEEDLFPSSMMLTSRADLEEERRLFYVAITRSEKKLTLSYATSRYQFGRLKHCEPSRFLNEIDENFLQREDAYTFSKSNNPPRSMNFVKSWQNSPKYTKKSLTQHKPSPDFKPSDTKALEVGMKVEHMKFGFGIVKEVQEFNNDRKACIEFDDCGEKTLLLSFAKLKIHS